MAPEKNRVATLPGEENAREISTGKSPVATTAPLVNGKKADRRGRPKTKPDSKLASFHLPLELIERIDAEAVRVCTGNKSALIVKMAEVYFRSIE